MSRHSCLRVLWKENTPAAAGFLISKGIVKGKTIPSTSFLGTICHQTGEKIIPPCFAFTASVNLLYGKKVTCSTERHPPHGNWGTVMGSTLNSKWDRQNRYVN